MQSSMFILKCRLFFAVPVFQSSVCFAVGKFVFFFAVTKAAQVFLQVSRS